jgi:hypothetical protein
MICQSTLCSLVVTVGFVVAVIDTASAGPDAVQVIVVDNHNNTRANPMALKSITDLIHKFAPQSGVEVLERTQNGDTTGGIHILVRHPNLKYLEDANAHIRASREWVDILKNLELTGRRLETAGILLDRTSD